MGAPCHGLSSKKYLGIETRAPEGSENSSLSILYCSKNSRSPAWTGWVLFTPGKVFTGGTHKAPRQAMACATHLEFPRGTFPGAPDEELSTGEDLVPCREIGLGVVMIAQKGDRWLP